jgi:hypothetical protein
MQAHQKKTEFRLNVLTVCLRRDARCTPCQFSFGGPGGIRTPVQDTFLFASYSNMVYYISLMIIVEIKFINFP